MIPHDTPQPLRKERSGGKPLAPAPDAALPAALREPLREILALHAGMPGALLPILHALQERIGHVPKETLPVIADALNLSRAEVHGVVTYYHHFLARPPAERRVQICRAEACQAMGADALLAHARAQLRCDADGRSADGRCSVEPVYCLGLCAVSPALMLNDDVHARVTPAAFDALMAQVAR